MTLVLMYHGVYGAGHGLEEIPAEDRPYALSAAEFERHIARLSPEQVLITFDDGDLGWSLHAAPLLKQFGCRAVFFVTPALIGKPGYCSWEQIRQLSELGHTIGTHGLTHQFLPDMDEQDCAFELAESKRVLEQQLGITVTSLSFPGGRFGDRELRLARQAGYQQCFTSEPGRADLSGFVVPRIAVRADTSLGWLECLLRGDVLHWWRLLLGYHAKRVLKKILGNRGYHELYRFLRG